MTKIKRTDHTTCGEYVQQLEFSSHWQWEGKMTPLLWNTVSEFLNVSLCLLQTTVRPLSVYPREKKTWPWTCTSASLTWGSNWKQGKGHHWRAERPANTGERPAVWVMTQQKQEQTTEKHNERHIVQNVRLRKRSRHKRVHIVWLHF